jgi:hypothetical protein
MSFDTGGNSLENGLLKKRTTVIKISLGITAISGAKDYIFRWGLFVRISKDRNK